MRKPGWYLIAYDITDPRRLRRLHRRLRADGIWMQQSVFLVRGDTRDIDRLMDELEHYVDQRDDDLRAYPVPAPGDIWLRGHSAVDGPVLLPGAAGRTKKPAPKPKRGLWERLRNRPPPKS